MAKVAAEEEEILLQSNEDDPPASHLEPLEVEPSPMASDIAHQEKFETRPGDGACSVLILFSLALIVLTSWATIIWGGFLSQGLFAYHPTFQTLAVALFGVGIMTLQPTAHPKTKARGLSRHQLMIACLGLPCLVIGTGAMIYNKEVFNRPHFTSWHARLALVALGWLIVQAFIGAGSVWFGGALFGGGAEAKRVWKYHRVSGYVLFPLFMLVINLGAAWGAFVSLPLRILVYTVAPIVAVVALWARARVSKMRIF